MPVEKQDICAMKSMNPAYTGFIDDTVIINRLIINKGCVVMAHVAC